uniref:NADH dehydrogenase [ubiquinone] 1 beta subcomplex subunit 3 n=1 Tax=Graphocephala atropunctata TaxID=36148 RepID=A0A1B6LA68_9HEMI
MGGDHHHHKVEVPDYRIYKVEDIPELVRVQKELARKGLKDPWLRNEVWRYNVDNYGTYSSRVRGMFGRGVKFGLIAFGVTVAIETVSGIMSPEMPNGHDHH